MSDGQLKDRRKRIRRRLDIIQTVTVLAAMGALLWLYFATSHSQTGKGNLKFWFAFVGAPVFLMDACFSFVSGFGWARGVKIDKEASPTLFYANLVASFVMAALCAAGIIYYR